MKAAEATHCAGEQGKYWEMHDRLFANQRELSRPDLTKHAQALGLNVATFDQCLDSGKTTARIRKDIAEAEKPQANGNPTSFIGPTGTETRSRGRGWWGHCPTRPSRKRSTACSRLLLRSSVANADRPGGVPYRAPSFSSASREVVMSSTDLSLRMRLLAHDDLGG